MSEPVRVPNIGPRQIQLRRRSGWTAFGIALAMAVLLILLDAPWWSRLAIFLPLWAAGIGFFQAREKT